MQNQPTPLAPSAAGTLAALRAETDRQTADLALGSGPVAALHVLIFACLARLLARLGDLLDLWHAGQLPAPHATNPTGLRQPAGAPRPIARPRARCTAGRVTPTRANPDQRAPAAHVQDRRHIGIAPCPPPPIPITVPPARRHRSKPTSGCLPDRIIRFSAHQTMPHPHAYNIPIS